jgi:hypothetical protein
MVFLYERIQLPGGNHIIEVLDGPTSETVA